MKLVMTRARIRRVSARVIGLVFQFCRIILFRMLSTASYEGRPRLNQPLQTHGAGKIIFSGRVGIGYFPSPGYYQSCAYIEARRADAVVRIGNGAVINNGFICIAESSEVSIGDKCLIGIGVEILNSDFHDVALSGRRAGKGGVSSSIIIGDEVFIGNNVTILKGVTIGAGSVIANSSVVVRDVPPMTVVAGIPAKVVGKVDG